MKHTLVCNTQETVDDFSFRFFSVTSFLLSSSFLALFFQMFDIFVQKLTDRPPVSDQLAMSLSSVCIELSFYQLC